MTLCYLPLLSPWQQLQHFVVVSTKTAQSQPPPHLCETLTYLHLFQDAWGVCRVHRPRRCDWMFFFVRFFFFQELVISRWCSSRGSPSSCHPTPTTRRCPPRWPQPGLSTRSEASRSSWAKRPTAQVGVGLRSHKPFSHREVALSTQRRFTNSPPLVVHTEGFSNEIHFLLYTL